MTAAHDEPVVPALDVEADATEDEHEGFPGGPSDPFVLTQYADHVACSVWTGEERPKLKLSSHGRKVHSLGRPVPAIEGLVAGTRISPLIACSVDTGDRGLLSSFVEQWHRETSSFHLPMGELTIMLDDVSSLLHLPVVGDLHAFQPLHVDDVVQMLVDLMIVTTESAKAEIGQCRINETLGLIWILVVDLKRANKEALTLDHFLVTAFSCLFDSGTASISRGPYVRLQWVRDIYERRCQAGHWIAAARAYLLHFLGCTLFANKSATNVHVVYLEALRDLSQTGRYAWGVATLVHMYNQLNDASISSNRQLGSFITLLQCWIYEHFPSVAESTADQDYDEDSPRACRWIATKKTVKSIRTPVYNERLDQLWILNVCWIPWMHYSDHIVPAGEVCVVPGQCASDYMDWSFRISHPFMTPGHASDPLPDSHAMQPRFIPQAPQTDILHVPEPGAPSTSARPVVEEPRHAVA
ncbi:Protein MAIN-LIKE 1 [Glycine max]|nr:Protein MAIN-LIKE 1 [Glycine max]